MRTVSNQHKAISNPVADLVTYRALPTISIDYIDPFLFLNHHGPQVYQPNNYGHLHKFRDPVSNRHLKAYLTFLTWVYPF